MMKFKRNLFLTGVVLAAAALVIAAGFTTAEAAKAQKAVILATTTSTQDSGLLDVLIPMFEKKTGYFVKTIAVGSGQAMAMGQKGEADVLLVHSPAAEKKFMADGNGVERRLIMHNDFIIVGPPDDPAKIKGMKKAAEAFKKIAASGSVFMSRGDKSGTHVKEMDIWKAAGVKVEGEKWYQQTGSAWVRPWPCGREEDLHAGRPGPTCPEEAGPRYPGRGRRDSLNIYHVIEVNHKKWPKANFAGGKAFADFMVSKEAQAVIKTFGVDKYGSPLSSPMPEEGEDLGCSR
jgi:tungstate transport system substrate-binding protein